MGNEVKGSDVASPAEVRVAGASMAERAYQVIRDRLVLLDIAPGAPIYEEHIATALGHGRTPVREALKRLETERLVVSYPRRGTFATDVNITELGHLSEVRQVLEPLAAAKAAHRATGTDRRFLGELLEELEAGGADAGGLTAMRLDLKVHRAIYGATHNPHLVDTLIRYDNLATRIWCLFLDRLPGMAGHVNEHMPLLHAIIDSEPTKAAAIAADHVTHFENEIRNVL